MLILIIISDSLPNLLWPCSCSPCHCAPTVCCPPIDNILILKISLVLVCQDSFYITRSDETKEKSDCQAPFSSSGISWPQISTCGTLDLTCETSDCQHHLQRQLETKIKCSPFFFLYIRLQLVEPRRVPRFFPFFAQHFVCQDQASREGPCTKNWKPEGKYYLKTFGVQEQWLRTIGLWWLWSKCR